jgi:hypothetical protein
MSADTETAAASELTARIAESPIRIADVSALLDGFTHPQRVAAIRSLGRAQQRALYQAADGFRPLRLEHLVPPSVADFTPVRHHGKNTLPLFTHFEKRFCRPHGEDAVKPSSLYGFNFQSMSPVTGPGYFVAREDDNRAEVLVDYNHVPPDHPEGWPAVRPNDRGLSRFVYGFMIDTLRGVSEHVSIGSAARKGRDLGSWFILCRED